MVLAYDTFIQHVILAATAHQQRYITLSPLAVVQLVFAKARVRNLKGLSSDPFDAPVTLARFPFLSGMWRHQTPVTTGWRVTTANS